MSQEKITIIFSSVLNRNFNPWIQIQNLNRMWIRVGLGLIVSFLHCLPFYYASLEMICAGPAEAGRRRSASRTSSSSTSTSSSWTRFR
jgi:hypothetical protein